MLKRFGFIVTAALCATLFSSSAYALDLDESTRSVPLDPSGTTVVLTPEQVKRGKRLFNASCGSCHVGGITKTNKYNNVFMIIDTLLYLFLIINYVLLCQID